MFEGIYSDEFLEALYSTLRMKIHYFLMLQFILGLFGCTKGPVKTITSNNFGPFTIETITTRGRSFNINYGMQDQETISYEVKYKGNPLEITDDLETNTGLPGIWRIFYLKDATTPSLILGSQSLVLITIENDTPVIKPLFSQGSDFASIQYLDSDEGQPGLYREVYSSDQADTDVELSGGRYMAITHAVVLDTRTFEVYPFNTDHPDVDGYYVHQHSAAAFSPDSSQVVYCGYRQDQENYNVNHYALVCFDFKAGTAYAVPFEKDSLFLKDDNKIPHHWISDYFEWVPQDSGKLKMQLKVLDKAPNRIGFTYHERYNGYRYLLDPVRDGMLTHLGNFIQKELQLPADSVQHLYKDQFDNRYLISYQGKTIEAKHGEYANHLIVQYTGDGMSKAENKEVMYRIANGFNALLKQGMYQEEWLPITHENE